MSGDGDDSTGTNGTVSVKRMFTLESYFDSRRNSSALFSMATSSALSLSLLVLCRRCCSALTDETLIFDLLEPVSHARHVLSVLLELRTTTTSHDGRVGRGWWVEQQQAQWSAMAQRPNGRLAGRFLSALAPNVHPS